jgi:transposase
MVKCNKDQVQRLQKALKLEKDPTLRQRIQMVLLREDGMTQPKVAELTGMSLSTVNRAHMAYDSGGVKGLRRKPTGGRRRENMTLKEEKAFLTTFTKAAGAGQLLNVRELKSAYEKQIGHPTSNSTMSSGSDSLNKVSASISGTSAGVDYAATRSRSIVK